MVFALQCVRLLQIVCEQFVPIICIHVGAGTPAHASLEAHTSLHCDCLLSILGILCVRSVCPSPEGSQELAFPCWVVGDDFEASELP